MKRITLSDALIEIKNLERLVTHLSRENAELKEKLEKLEKAERNPRSGGRQSLLTDEMRHEIFALSAAGETQRDIASVFKVGVATIN
jgi:phage shock protein A